MLLLAPTSYPSVILNFAAETAADRIQGSTPSFLARISNAWCSSSTSLTKLALKDLNEYSNLDRKGKFVVVSSAHLSAHFPSLS